MLPDLLRLTDPGLHETLDALPASMAVIGVGTDGQPVTVDLDGAPHVLVSTCGGGSSTILRTLTAQLLHHGAHALAFDIKRISHLWARELPTVSLLFNLDLRVRGCCATSRPVADGYQLRGVRFWLG
ncbi:hypothetical protein ACFY1B_45845 [Streptomyces mirabilis]|uniref:hypothetical protein n=1 Tax=Streptomyces mirabilis TaxID=68239 RepID=UPI0036C362FC